jgi:hypothetical protein
MGKHHAANNASPAQWPPKMAVNPPVTPGWINTKISRAVRPKKPKRRAPAATRDEPLAKKGPKHRKPRRA